MSTAQDMLKKLKNGFEFETSFSLNPKADSPFRLRATRLNDRRCTYPCRSGATPVMDDATHREANSRVLFGEYTSGDCECTGKGSPTPYTPEPDNAHLLA
jgi:hypothetical protein